jgi:uroporphyrinogen III methyltransferase/synthase
MKKGMVYLVGAGPGDIGLLTLRARDVLQCCDACIYDNLVNETIVRMFSRPECEKIYVGKSGAAHTMEQDEINKLIAAKAMENKIVVRLKGGDPYIFGRGGEEALFLAESGVPFEVVNGISSAYAVPAYAGIPVTNRGFSSSVAFITGHEDPTKLESDINWEKIATGVQTLVFLMGVKNLALITDMLVRHGRPPSTPAAVVENGCSPKQRTVTGSLGDIAGRVAKCGIRPPSVFVVGDVVSLREKINWYESRPLFGRTVLVTRSREQASVFSAKLSELGAEVIEVPAIKTIPPDDAGPLLDGITNLNRYDWILFTSVNGVSYFFKYLHETGSDSRKLSACKICAIGPVTGERLEQFGIKPDLIPEKFVSDDIVRALIHAGEVRGRSFLLPRADIAPKTLSEALLEAGARAVDDIVAYRTVEEDNANVPGLEEMLINRKFDLVTFTSSSTVKNFEALIRRCDPNGNHEGIPCAAIGPVTAHAARELGFKVEITADTHTIDGLVEAIRANFSRR